MRLPRQIRLALTAAGYGMQGSRGPLKITDRALFNNRHHRPDRLNRSGKDKPFLTFLQICQNISELFAHLTKESRNNQQKIATSPRLPFTRLGMFHALRVLIVAL